MEIPFSQISGDALRGLVEEFISREGTDYGFETELDDKVAQVMRQLRRGEAIVTYDEESETASIKARE